MTSIPHRHNPDPVSDQIRVFGRAASAAGYEIRDFLGRSVVAYEWVELATDDDARREVGVDSLKDPRLPVCLFPDGARIESATARSVADQLGWITKPRHREYDVSIYGAGPAGLSAALYAASEGLRTVLIEREAVGGQAGTSSWIENYLGFPGGISGAHLAERARQQAVAFGAEILLMREGIEARFSPGGIVVQLADGDTLSARANICATGVEYQRLGVTEEDRYLGAGVYYGAAASEASFCAGEDVYVVGGGNSAGQATMHLASHARSVTMLMRQDKPAASMSTYLLDRLEAASNVTIRTRSRVIGLDGDDGLRSVTLSDGDGVERTVSTRRLFVMIGGRPNTEWAKDTAIVRDRAGYLVTGPDLLTDGKPPTDWPLTRPPYHLETNVPGSFAAGDVRLGAVKRVAAAVGEGAMAVTLVHRHLQGG